MKFWGGGDDDLSETDLPTVPDDEPVERPKYYEFMIHTPSEGLPKKLEHSNINAKAAKFER